MKLTPVFAATTVIAGIAAVYLFQQLHTARDRSNAMQNRVTELELAQARLPAAVTPAITPTITAPSSTAPETPSPVAQSPAPAAVKVNSNDLMKDPDFRASIAASLRQSLAQQYADVGKELGLSTEQTSKLLDILANNALTISGVSIGSGSGPSNPRDAVQASADAQRRQDDEIRALLGESRLQQWKQYQQMVPARQQVSLLQAKLESAGGSLGQREQQQLIATIAAAKKRETEDMTSYLQTLGPDSPRNGMALMEKSVEAAEDRNRRIIDASQSYLSPQQLEVLLAQQNQEVGASRAVLRAQRPREPARE